MFFELIVLRVERRLFVSLRNPLEYAAAFGPRNPTLKVRERVVPDKREQEETTWVM
jgi:hypothetical protein